MNTGENRYLFITIGQIGSVSHFRNERDSVLKKRGGKERRE